MARNIVHFLVCALGLLAGLAESNSLFEKRETLERRDCPAGATTCSTSGLIRYCAAPGWKCCDATHSAPNEATCCPGGYYALTGSYCCQEGGSCRNGRTCRGCTPANGTPGSVGAPEPTSVAPPVTAAPSVTLPPLVVTYTYTFTLTYFYYQYYYIYVPSLTRSTATSSEVTTRTRLTIYASNSAAAQSSFSAFSATAVLPTPVSATALPPLPSQTADVPSIVSTRGLVSATGNASPSPSQFVGAASGVWVEGSLIVSMSAWMAVFAVGVLGVGINFLL